MNKTLIRIVLVVMALSLFLISFSEGTAQNHNNEELESLQDPEGKEGGGSGGGGQSDNCFYVQIDHAPNFSWIKVMCAGSAYIDPSYPDKCTCGSPNEVWYL